MVEQVEDSQPEASEIQTNALNANSLVTDQSANQFIKAMRSMEDATITAQFGTLKLVDSKDDSATKMDRKASTTDDKVSSFSPLKPGSATEERASTPSNATAEKALAMRETTEKSAGGQPIEKSNNTQKPDGIEAMPRAYNQNKTKGLIDDLSADKYATREKAESDLKSLGPDALPQLHKALNDSTDAEQKRRLSRVIDSVERGAIDKWIKDLSSSDKEVQKNAQNLVMKHRDMALPKVKEQMNSGKDAATRDANQRAFLHIIDREKGVERDSQGRISGYYGKGSTLSAVTVEYANQTDLQPNKVTVHAHRGLKDAIFNRGQDGTWKFDKLPNEDFRTFHFNYEQAGFTVQDARGRNAFVRNVVRENSSELSRKTK